MLYEFNSIFEGCYEAAKVEFKFKGVECESLKIYSGSRFLKAHFDVHFDGFKIVLNDIPGTDESIIEQLENACINTFDLVIAIDAPKVDEFNMGRTIKATMSKAAMKEIRKHCLQHYEYVFEIIDVEKA